MIKKVTNFIIPFVITTLILLAYFYLVHGLPVAQELEKTNIVSVQIMQENKTITLTNDEDIEKAVNVVKVLSFHLEKLMVDLLILCAHFIREMVPK